MCLQDYFEASREMLQAAQASGTNIGSSGGAGQTMSSSYVVHQRRHNIRVLHFALMMLQACSRGRSTSTSSSVSDSLRYALCLVRCRNAVLAGLASELRSVALTDHPSLSPYRALLRAQYAALLADMKQAYLQSSAKVGRKGSSRAPGAGSHDDIDAADKRGSAVFLSRVLDGLLRGVVSLIAVDHRPVVEGEENGGHTGSDTAAPSSSNNGTVGSDSAAASVVLVQLLRALRAVDLAALAPVGKLSHGDGRGSATKGIGSGAEAVLLSLIKLYHDLRM
jgi:hypothetical protein